MPVQCVNSKPPPALANLLSPLPNFRNFLVFDKLVVDKACKDKHCRTFDAGFKVEVYLHRIDDSQFSFETVEDEGDTKEDTDTDTEEERGKAGGDDE